MSAEKGIKLHSISALSDPIYVAPFGLNIPLLSTFQ